MGFKRLPPAVKVSSEQDAVKVLRVLEKRPLIAFDTETTGLIRCRDRAVLLSLSEGVNRWCIWPQAIKYFAELLQDPARRLIGHNVNFDQWMLLNIGIDIDKYTPRNRARCLDTMVMHALIDDASPHDLKFLARLFLDIDMIPFKQVYGAQMKHRALEDILLDPINEAVTVNYSALDAFATFELFNTLQRLLLAEQISEPGSPYKNLWQYYVETEVMFTKVLWHMEREGIDLNIGTLMAKAPVSEARLVELNHWFCHKLGRWDVNVNSGLQLETLFFEKLGAVPMSYTESGKPQITAVFLKDRARQGCEYATNLLEHRHISKRLSTNIIGALETVGKDGRIHTTYKQTGARSGRLACFAKGTPVEIHNEVTNKPAKLAVECVKQGMLAYSFDTGKELVLRKVLWAGKTGHTEVIRIHWLGAVAGHLDVTADHKIKKLSGEYCEAKELVVGDYLLAWSSTEDITRNTRVVRLEALTDTVDVYDMEVEETHNLIAGGISASNSNSINLQNVPPDMRDAFEAGDGYILVSRDESQLEMRLTAHASGDVTLCDAIRTGKDVHSATAAAMYHVSYEDVMAARAKEDLIAAVKERNVAHTAAHESVEEVPKLTDAEKLLLKQRKGAKTINFGILYGMGPGKLSRDLGIGVAEAKEIIATYFAALPGIPTYFADKTEAAYKTSFTTTVLGRRRQVRGINSLLNSEQAQAIRQVKNSPIQGFASEVLKLAMNAVFADQYIYNTGTRLLLQIHDELIFRVPAAFAKDQELFNRIEWYMTKTTGIPMRIPLAVSGRDGKNWADCK